MKVFIISILLSYCCWSTYAADAPASDPFLLSLNKAEAAQPEARAINVTVSVPDDVASPKASGELDNDRKKQIREEFFREREEREFREKLERDEKHKQEQEALQDLRRKQEMELQNNKVAGRVPVAPPVPVPPTNLPTIPQRQLIPNQGNFGNMAGPTNNGYQQPMANQYAVPVSNQPVRQPVQEEINPMMLLASGGLASILHPKIPNMDGNSGSSLVPALIGPGLKQSMEKQQQSMQNPNANMMDPRQLQGFPQNNLFNNGFNNNGMGAFPLQGQQAIPNFGQATPTFQNPQFANPQGTMNTMQMPTQTAFGSPMGTRDTSQMGMMNGYGNTANMNPALSNYNLNPQVPFQG